MGTGSVDLGVSLRCEGLTAEVEIVQNRAHGAISLRLAGRLAAGELV
jgi:hypothetical protein